LTKQNDLKGKNKMFSLRNPGKVYPVSKDVTENDLDADVEEYNYDGRLVFRGNLDTDNSTPEVEVYWLYDENSIRVGLAEHANGEHTALWFKDNEFSTLLQEDWEPQDRTLWSLMTLEAYEDCMKNGWNTIEKVSERTRLTIVTPSMIIDGVPELKKCTKCMGNRQKGCFLSSCKSDFDVYSTMFVDNDGVLFTPPSDSSVYATLRLRAGLASEEVVSTGVGVLATGI
jgi:hypothetical protein